MPASSETQENEPDIGRDDVVDYFQVLSNWGRWGSDDQLGTLNLITPELRLRHSELIRTGEVVSCARQITPSRNAGINQPYLHHMLASGSEAPADGWHALTDWVALEPHGSAMTHMDALNHMAWNGRLYNDRDAKEVTARRGSEVASVEAANGGIVGRGVLLDIPESRGRDWLEPGEAIFPADLDRCEAAAGISVEPGDVLMVRTGRDVRAAEFGEWDHVREGVAGLHASCLPWLRERDVAVLVSDAAQDVMPSGFDDLPVPVHLVGITAMGLWMLDNAYLERLRVACKDAERWEFFFTAAVIPLRNSTGSPITPLAIF